MIFFSILEHVIETRTLAIIEAVSRPSAAVRGTMKRRRRRSGKESGVETWVHARGKLSTAQTATTTEKLPVFITPTTSQCRPPLLLHVGSLGYSY